MHLKRLIVAAVLLPLIYLYIMFLPVEYFFLLFAAVTIVAMSEFYSMYRVTGILRYICLCFGVVILGRSYFLKEFSPDIIILAVMTVLVLRLFIKKTPVSSLSDISPPVIGLLYIPGLFSYQIMIREFGPQWIIFLYVSVWASDSFAYYIGKGLGKRKLYPAVSPNKTVAGAIGSLSGGVAGALIMKATLTASLSILSAVVIGLIISVVAIVGDLIESMFKRDAGVKDSSRIIPGHGGILDKLDAALFAGPVLYWMLNLTDIIGFNQ